MKHSLPPKYTVEHVGTDRDDRSGESEVTEQYEVRNSKTGEVVARISEEDYDSYWQSNTRDIDDIRVSADGTQIEVVYLENDRRSNDPPTTRVESYPLGGGS